MASVVSARTELCSELARYKLSKYAPAFEREAISLRELRISDLSRLGISGVMNAPKI